MFLSRAAGDFIIRFYNTEETDKVMCTLSAIYHWFSVPFNFLFSEKMWFHTTQTTVSALVSAISSLKPKTPITESIYWCTMNHGDPTFNNLLTFPVGYPLVKTKSPLFMTGSSKFLMQNQTFTTWVRRCSLVARICEMLIFLFLLHESRISSQL